MPSFSLPDVTTGQNVDVSEHLAQGPGAIVFMQTSCSACRRELKVFKALVEKFPEFKVVAISVDAGGPKRVVRYKDGYEFPFLFLHDPEYEKPDLFGAVRLCVAKDDGAKRCGLVLAPQWKVDRFGQRAGRFDAGEG